MFPGLPGDWYVPVSTDHADAPCQVVLQWPESVRGATLRHFSDIGEGGCVVAGIATVAGVDYAAARAAAVRVAGFNPEKGMGFLAAKKVLAEFGITSKCYYQADDWSELPDLALVGVEGKTSGGHSVVLERVGGQDIIYDCLHPTPILREHGSYKLKEDDEYLEIIR